MNRAVDKANEIISRFKTNDPEKILEKLGVDILDVSLKGRLKEIFFGDHIVLKKGLEREERRQLLAHALCHHLMHSGNHWQTKNRAYSFGNYHERQADVFAAYLLIPTDELKKIISPSLATHQVAEHFNVSAEFADFRLKLIKHYQLTKQVIL